MTPTRYYLSRIARAFGIQRRNQRMGDAASETHLLRDAEAYLGLMVWEKVEKLEPLASNYWNLRKLAKEREALTTALNSLQDRLADAHGERAQLLNNLSEPEEKLVEEKAEIVAKMGELAAKRTEVVNAAQEIRKSYDGLKIKSEVLAKEAAEAGTSSEELEKIQASFRQLKSRFSSLKEERTRISLEIDKGDTQIAELNERIKTQRKSQHDEASKALQTIGDANKEISTLRAECGVIDTRMSQLYAEIGKYVSRNESGNSVCSEIVKEQHGLVEVMKALRKSISLNYKLADM